MSTSNDFLFFFKQYISLEKKFSKHTINAYCRDIDEFQIFLNENHDAATVKEASYPLIRNWIIFLADQSLHSKSINRKIASLNCYFKFLLKSDQIKSNPLIGHKSLKTPKTKQIPFSEEEMTNLFGNFPEEVNFKNTRNRLILELLYCTGIRRIELVNLEHKNIDLNAKTFKVLGKRNKERIIPLVPNLLPYFKAYIIQKNKISKNENGIYFFTNTKNQQISESFVYRLVVRFITQCSEKIKKSPHMLRHTFATHLVNNGAEINAIKELLGHTSLAATQIYTNSSLKELQNAYNNAHPRNIK